MKLEPQIFCWSYFTLTMHEVLDTVNRPRDLDCLTQCVQPWLDLKCSMSNRYSGRLASLWQKKILFFVT